MEVLMLLICLISSTKLCICNEDDVNSTDPNKDMYVINAMVYQVGIVTNATGDTAANDSLGNQEALTFYHTNGSNIDLSGIPQPLMTNVTAQSLVGVAPKSNGEAGVVPWSTLDHLTNVQATHNVAGAMGISPSIINENSSPLEKRSFNNVFKRDVADDVKITKGTTNIPQAAKVESLALPPLLTLNNNMSNIPVPIPNTSIVHYAKINTLLTPASNPV